MLTEEKMRSLPEPAQTFWRKAWAFLAKNQTDWVWIETGTEEMAEWMAYFQKQNWEPFAIRQIRHGKLRKITMPAQWPEWFENGPAA